MFSKFVTKLLRSRFEVISGPEVSPPHHQQFSASVTPLSQFCCNGEESHPAEEIVQIGEA